MNLKNLRPKGRPITTKQKMTAISIYDMIQELSAEVNHLENLVKASRKCDCDTDILMRSGCKCGGK